MGPDGARACLAAGANDLGGTLMNESITRAAGAAFGQELPPAEMRALIAAMRREPYQRTTLYAQAPAERGATAMDAAPLTDVVNPPLQHRARAKDRRLVRFGQV
jgi:FO synthase